MKFGVFPLLSVGALRGPAGTCGVSQHLNRDLMLDPLDLNNPKKESKIRVTKSDKSLREQKKI